MNPWGKRFCYGVYMAAAGLILMALLLANPFPVFDPAATTVSANKVKATWLWDTSLINTPDSRNVVLQFAKEQRVNRIYLQLNDGTAASAYSAFIKTASMGGIEIHALDGAPDWVKPDKLHHVTETVKKVKAYNQSVAQEERFAGIQVDIEPYILPDSEINRETTANRWLEAITLFAAETKADAGLTASAALPFWLDEIKINGSGKGSGSWNSGTLFEAMMEQLDEVTLMSYRNEANALVEIAASELVIGDRLGKKVFVGVETNQTSEPPFITFYGKGRAKMELELASIDKLLRLHRSYAGIAVHDYTGWRNLKE